MVRMIGRMDAPSSPSELPPIETSINRIGKDSNASMVSGRREGACRLGDILVIRPHNLGWLETKLQPAQLEFIWERVAEAKGVRDAKPTLAGIIDSSWELQDKDDWFFMNVIDPLITRYQQEFDKGILWSSINFKWPNSNHNIVSARDKNHPTIEDLWNEQFLE